MVKYLDSKGLGILWDKTKSYAQSQAKAITDTKGAANGLATLDENGKIPVAQLGNLDTELFKVVTELPKTDILTDKIYIVKDSTNENDLYQEYYYTNGAWEELGTHAVKVDLEPYAKTTEVDNKIREVQVDVARNSTDIGDIKKGFAAKADKTELSKYLPLTGGHITGNVSLPERNNITIGGDNYSGHALHLYSSGMYIADPSMGEEVGTSYDIDGINVNPDGNKNNKLLFPEKAGTFALTSDIPDITGKVDKVEGKSLSTNDYTTAEKTKLAGIPADANHIDVDSTLSDSSENPVQNKVVKAALDNYLPLSGGTINGSIAIDTKGSEKVLIDNTSLTIIGDEYANPRIMYTRSGIYFGDDSSNSAKVLRFQERNGIIATTEDIPDVSGKADTATVNAELAKKLNASDITAISEDELTALLV